LLALILGQVCLHSCMAGVRWVPHETPAARAATGARQGIWSLLKLPGLGPLLLVNWLLLASWELPRCCG
jgi:hypothetical protein